MGSAIQFFKDLGTDIGLLVNGPEGTPCQDIRTSSVALRVLGLLTAFASAYGLLAGLSLVAGSPAMAAGLLALTALGAAVSRDLFVMGNNQRNLITLATPVPPDAGLLDTIGHYVNGAYQVGKAAVREQTRETPYTLHDTWLFERLYKLCASAAKEEGQI